MSEYTPTPGEVRRGWGLMVDSCRRPALLAEFDRMIAEVERAAAEKALTDAANAVLVSEWWAEDVTNRAGNTCESVREWLRNRAGGYRRDEGGTR